jgi:ribosomal subunit interface protein
MSFPTINFNFNDLKEAQALTDIAEQKMSSLVKYIHNGDGVICDFEFSKVAAQQNGQIYKVDVNLSLEGTLYRAEAVEESFEKAIDEVRAELDKEMRRAKDKQVTLDKQAGREAKEQMLD